MRLLFPDGRSIRLTETVISIITVISSSSKVKELQSWDITPQRLNSYLSNKIKFLSLVLEYENKLIAYAYMIRVDTYPANDIIFNVHVEYN